MRTCNDCGRALSPTEGYQSVFIAPDGTVTEDRCGACAVADLAAKLGAATGALSEFRDDAGERLMVPKGDA